MCTVTFIPTPSACYITSNRDEHPGRQAHGLVSKHHLELEAIHFPLDELSGGSWITLSDSGRVVCLLNGAYQPFKPSPPYRMSRGQVVVDLAATADIQSWFDHYVLEGVAPFTILAYEHGRLFELIWDGIQKHPGELPADQPQIWSSVTLYPQDVRAWRKSLFDEWMSTSPRLDRDAIIDFHRRANGDPGNGFVMNRNDIVKTLSITSVVLKHGSGSMLHLSLDRDAREEVMVRYGA